MTPEQVSRPFERFAQADTSTSRRLGGTGLGLSLTRAFANVSGGTFAVESEPGHRPVEPVGRVDHEVGAIPSEDTFKRRP